ncbi:c-type cytochrome [Pseudoalteromonas sp. SSDWG2]|uniref:c-type cytochrome n=1 Tax=Pseudoalteromonas sp. SSDWG2 TaxID=3139391 RepID=UPI003BA94CC0
MLAFPSLANEQLAKRCQSCHGLDGIATADNTPHLKGQHRAYLRQQLMDYKTRKRRHGIMSAMAATLTQQEIDQLANYYGVAHRSEQGDETHSADK